MEKQSDHDVNLNFLRENDDKTQNIILNCGQSALYEFANGKWVRKNIEGTLFLVKRVEAPLFKIIIPNKLPMADVDVFQEGITENYEINLEAPYALCKNAQNVINCFWFYNKEMCKSFEQAIKACVQTIKKENEKKALGSSFSKLTLSAAGDIPQMLSLEDIENDTFNSSGTPKQPPRQLIEKIKVKVEKSQTKTESNQNALIGAALTPGRRSVKLEDLLNQNTPNGNNHVQHQATIKSSPSEDEAEEVVYPRVPPSAPLPAQASNKPASIVEPTQPRIHQFPGNLGIAGTHMPINNKPPSISLEELKQSLIYLLQNDADFLFSVYETYKNRIAAKNNH